MMHVHAKDSDKETSAGGFDGRIHCSGIIGTAIFSEPDYRFKPLQIGSFCPPKNGDIVSRTAQALSDRFTLFHIKFRVWFPIDTQRISRLPRAMGI